MERFSLNHLVRVAMLALQTVLLLSISRWYFYINNHTFFNGHDAGNLVKAFIHGVRFDISSTSLLLAPFILLIVGLSWSKWFQRYLSAGLMFIALVITAMSLVINTVDAEYFPYTGKRSGPEVLHLWLDFYSQAGALIMTYWRSILLSLILVALHSVLFFKWGNRIHIKRHHWVSYLLCSIICIFLALLGGRGSIESKPIRPLHAYSWPDPQLGGLVSNSVFTLIKEKPSALQKHHFYGSDQQALMQFYQPLISNLGRPNTKNVVIILLESFGMEYFGPPYSYRTYTPFINTLAKKSLFFPFGIANGRRSIEAIPSVLAGLPSLLDEDFMRSSYQGNQLYGLGEILKRYGYETAFFHGANNGSMYFDATTQRLGFDQYYGRNEYNNEADFDGQWGIFDEPFLQYTIKRIDKLKTPFAVGVFTISSHPPYSVPSQYKDRFESGDIPMHRVVQYSDYALSQFFAVAERQSWFKDTLFIVTADHTSDNYDANFSSVLSRHQIPILLYAADIKPQTVRDLAQQIDIPATVIDYLNLPEQSALLPFGQSLLQPSREGRGFFQDQDAYWLLSGSRFVTMNKHDHAIEFGFLPSSFEGVESAAVSDEVLEAQLKAMVQVYANATIENRYYSSNGRD